MFGRALFAGGFRCGGVGFLVVVDAGGLNVVVV